MTIWQRDILGDGFECTVLPLGDDDEGEIVASLVRHLPDPQNFWARTFGPPRPLEDVDVLYVHGWSDYFFQRDLAHFWTEQGANFYALDLRKYGRSLREGQTHGYIENLADYDAEIDQALAIIQSGESHRRLVLFGHSTGGLVLSLWANRNPGRADALILNSPWLELQLSGAMRKALAPVVNLRALLNPHDIALPQLDLGFYKRAQMEVSEPGETDSIVEEWRPQRSFPVLSGWLRAVLAGHQEVSHGLKIDAPVFVMLSRRSEFGLSWRDEMTSCDSVLEVDGISRAALKLGQVVTVNRIDGALHDIFLSQKAVRDTAYQALKDWVVGWNATRHHQTERSIRG